MNTQTRNKFSGIGATTLVLNFGKKALACSLAYFMIPLGMGDIYAFAQTAPPPPPDQQQYDQVKDPQTLAVAVIADGVSYGAQDDDTIGILTAPSGTVAPGAPLPFTVMVNSRTSPAAGATVTYSVAQGNATLGCGQPSCSVVTAANGTATLAVAASSTTPASVTAILANGASVSTQFTAATGTAAAISALTPNLYLASGAVAQWTPQGLVLKNGSPAADAVVTWVPAATGVTAPTTASLSGSNGIVTQQLSVGPLAGGMTVPVNACLATGSGCAQFDVVSVPASTAQLQPIAGVSQTLAAGQFFSPVALEVTDSSGHPLAGAIVTFYETLDRWTPPCSPGASCPPAPLIQQQTAQATSGPDGMVVLTPIDSSSEAARLYVTAVVGNSAILNFELEQHP